MTIDKCQWHNIPHTNFCGKKKWLLILRYAVGDRVVTAI